jgi:hypothetical protein
MIETEVVEMLDKLSQQLGVASSKIWEWSILQVKVDLITDIVVILLAIGLTLLFAKYSIRTYKNWDDICYSTQGNIIVALVIFGALLFIFDIFAIISIFELPRLIINPEYSAFQNIMNQLSKLK